MTYRIRLSERAKQDRDIIRAHLRQFYRNTAKNFFSALKKHLSLLCDSPYIGTPHKDHRRLVVGEYLVFYQVDEIDRMIVISRILHGSQNMDMWTSQET